MVAHSRGLRIVCTLILCAIPSFTFAQASSNADCPQYAKDTGITVSLSSELTATVPSVPVGIHATIQNNSGGDAADGALFVRAIDTSVSPQIVVDEFVAAKSLTVAAGSSKDVDFVWTVPADVATGDYRVEVFFVYPSSLFVPPPGLEPQNTAALTMHVASEAGTQTAIDTSHISVSGATYNPADAAYVFSDGSPITVSLPIVNSTATPFKGTIHWILYQRGRAPDSTPAQEETDEVKAHPGENTTATYTISNPQAGSYYLEAQLSNDISRSIIAIPLLGAGTCAAFPVPTSGGTGTSTLVLLILGLIIVVFGGGFLLRRIRHDS